MQSQIITNGFQHNEYVTPKLVCAWAELKNMWFARSVFDQVPEPNVVLRNTILRGYSQNEFYRETLALFVAMKNMDLRPDCFTLPIIFKSCAKIHALKEGEGVHCYVIKSGFKSNTFVGTTLIDLYSSGGEIESAYKVFAKMTYRNTVSWTSMINGYILAHEIAKARQLFDLAPERDIILWNIMISGYIESGDMAAAHKLFDHMPNRDRMAWNTILTGYAQNGDIDLCEKMFKDIPEKNVFSWNGLISGYARKGRFIEVLDAFKRMLSESIVNPNDATLVTVLTACSRLGALDMGKWVHAYSESNEFKGNVYVGNALIDMYAKCGVIENSITVFESMQRKDLIAWNTIINGLAVHGRGAEALCLFSEMKKLGEKPDGVTFIAILCACTHLGLVEDGFLYFQSMIEEYSIEPQIEHYGCMIDLLARAGFLEQAMKFLKEMPLEADSVMWTSLLGACKIHKNFKLAELALSKLIELEPKNPSNYVMLSNIYGDFGRWKDVARLKVAMRDTGFRKLPGCSLIEVNDDVVEFYSLDERHKKSTEIYEALRRLTKMLKSYWYVLDCLELG